MFPSELANGLLASRNPEDEGYGHPLFLPTQRFGGEEEMGGTILYLASRAGAYCDGVIVPFDGGRMAVTTANY